ncbi:hypothetical protein BGZ75_000290 [Mortierella antarctica]|nr:hypothetical protein BGZ75_000290 [Mortierella antarctica]
MKKQQLDAPGDSTDSPDVSPTVSQQSQPPHAQAESSSSASTRRSERRASSSTKKTQEKPSTTKKKRQQHRSPTREPNEDREVKVEPKARTKRPKISPASDAPPPADTTTEVGSTLSTTTATLSEMDIAPSLSAATIQEAVTLTSSPAAGAVDVNMAAIANCDPSSAATPSTHASVNSKVRQSKMFMSAVIIPPYKGPSSGSSSPTSSRRSHITTLSQPPSVPHSVTLSGAVPNSALEAETIDALTPAPTPKVRLKLIRNRMEPHTQLLGGSNSEKSIDPSAFSSGADLAIEQGLVMQREKITATNASVQETRAKAKVVAVSKRRAESVSATSDGEPSTTSIEIQLKKRSKSAPLSVSRDDEPELQTTPKLEGSQERVLSDSGQDGESICESESRLPSADIAPVPVQKEILGARAGDGMVGGAGDKEGMVTEDQEEGHLGTVHPNPFISSMTMTNTSLQPRTRAVSKTSEGGDVVQGDKQNERFPEQPRSTRLSRSQSRGPSTAPTRVASQAPSRPRVPAPDNGALTEPTQILAAQHDVADDALGGEAIGPAASSNGQQDRSTSTQQLWDQPWTKQYASIKPMRRRNTIVESGIASSPSKSSQSSSITSCVTSSSNSANNTMAPDERMASEKKIVSMDQTPPTPKSTDDTERQAKTTRSKELRESKNNDSRQCEHEENIKAESTPMFPNERPYMEAQADEMDGGGSSYSPDATYDCLSPTNPYHSVEEETIRTDHAVHENTETTRGREDTEEEDRTGPAIVFEVGQETDLRATQAERTVPGIDLGPALWATQARHTAPGTDREIAPETTRADPITLMTGQEIALRVARSDPVIPITDQEIA